MRRLFLYILAICLFPQVMSASVLAGRPEGEFSISPSGAATYTIPIKIPSGPSDFGPFYRTYTGHEDLWMFGLLNANARLYSPYLGRFVSPDPLLNEDGGLLDFTPYVYARNNPYRYIDRNGEFWWIAVFALAGAVLNVCNNIDNIHNVWDAFAGAGAVAGAIGGWVGPAAAGVLGLGTTGAISCAVSGFISGATSNIFQGALNSAVMVVPYSFSWQSCLMETGISAVTAGLVGGISAKASGGKFWKGNSGVQYSKTDIDAIYPSENIHDTSNNLGNVVKQVNPKDVVTQSLESQQMPIGQGNSSVYVGYDEVGTIRYVGRTDRMPEFRFGEHYRAGTAVPS